MTVSRAPLEQNRGGGQPEVLPPPKAAECVKVVVRCRPMNDQEISDGRQQVLFMDKDTAMAHIQKPHGSERDAKDFTYDAAYNEHATQAQIYDETASVIVDSVMEGYNGTVFCYGQTGSGKTHTMAGPSSGGLEMKGLLPRAFEHIFRSIESADPNVTRFLVRASFLEIYNEEIRDLLSKDVSHKCELKENPDSGVYVRDLSAFVVKSVGEMDQVLTAGIKMRHTGATLMNAESSRSHSIFTVTVEMADVQTGGAEDKIRVGKLNMVDLAGSERQSKTGATGERLKEATKINLSLSALGNVISSLVDGRSSHIPYRDSKLTRLLQDSLGGNTKTMMVANCGPADYNYEETLSTLRYAYRAKSIKNKPRINEDPKDAMIREFQDEIARLRQQLLEQQANVQQVAGTVNEGGKLVTEKVVVKEVVIEKNNQDLGDLEERLRRENEEARLATEKRRKEIEEKRDMADAERKAMLLHLEEKETALSQAQRDQALMLHKLKAMGEKMLQGSAVIEKAVGQEKELRKTRQELAARTEAASRAKMEAEEKEAAKEKWLAQCVTQEEQAAKLTHKLESLWGKFQQARQEIEDITEEFQKDKADMTDTVRQLYRELELKTLAVENFVPRAEMEAFVNRCRWDEDFENWIVEKVADPIKERREQISKRPASCFGAPKPISEYARDLVTLGDANPRYRFDNILITDLEMPERTTLDYEDDPSYGPNFERLLKLAFGNHDFDSATTLGVDAKMGGNGQKVRENDARNTNRNDETMAVAQGDDSSEGENLQKLQKFPQARGLMGSRGGRRP